MKTIWKKATTLCVLGVFSLFFACMACSDDNGTGKEKEKEKEEEREEPEKPKPEEGTPKYYVSSSTGSDSNDGRTKETPWKTLAKINTGTYNPGDSILLKCGDTWEEAVIFNSIFHGSETAPIVLSSYGTGNRPKITQSSKDIRVLMLIYNADYFTVSNLDFGPFYQYGLRFDINDNKEHSNVLVENVHVHDMKLVGIYFNARETPPYRDITISKCTGDKVEMLSAVARCKDAKVYDCVATECIYGGMYFSTVDGGEMARCKVFNSGTGNYENGACGIYLGSNKNFTVSNCEVAFQRRFGTNPDGEGIDFECANINVTVKDCHLHDNDGCGIMFYDNRRGAINEGCVVENCLFENNGRNWLDPKGFDIHFTKAVNNKNGIIRNNTFNMREGVRFLTTTDATVTVDGNKNHLGEPLIIAPKLQNGQPQLLNGGFESPAFSTYDRQPSGASWTFRGGGIARNGSAWGAPNAPEGSQVLFLQGLGSNITQWVDFPAGTFKLTFKLAYRNRGANTENGLAVYVDDVKIGDDIMPGLSFEAYESAPFTVAAGYRLIELTSTIAGDKTVFVDDVCIVPCTD